MRVFSTLLLVMILTSMIYSCTQRVCPAYQSFYLLDEPMHSVMIYSGFDLQEAQVAVDKAKDIMDSGAVEPVIKSVGSYYIVEYGNYNLLRDATNAYAKLVYGFPQSSLAQHRTIRDSTYSYFVTFADSLTPRRDMIMVSRNQFGIIQGPVVSRVPVIRDIATKVPDIIYGPFRKLNNLDKEVLYPVKDDSLEMLEMSEIAQDLDSISQDTGTDSATGGKIWHYNIEQENYFNYLRDRLKMPLIWYEGGGGELDSIMETSATDIGPTSSPDTTQKKKGLFKNLFGKKKKKDKQQTTDPSDTTSVNQN